MVKRVAAVTASVAALAVPSAAPAADYRGTSSQDWKVSARVKDGRLKLLKIYWHALCEGGSTWHDRTRWVDSPDDPIEHEGSRFTDSGTIRRRLPEARATYRLKLSGEFTEARVRGKMTVRVRVYHPGGGYRLHDCRETIRFEIPKV